jgi:hypothetical protein
MVGNLLQRVRGAGDGVHVVPAGEVDVTGESFARLAIHEKTDAGELRKLSLESEHEREDGELLYLDSTAMGVGEGRVEVDHGGSGIEQVNVMQIRAGAERVRRILFKIAGDESVEGEASTLAGVAGQGGGNGGDVQ